MPDQAREMNQTVVFSRDVVRKFQLIFFPEKRKPEKEMQDQFGQRSKKKSFSFFARKISKNQACWQAHILLLLNFKSDHVALSSYAIGNNIGLHASAFVMVCFNVLLVFCPARHKPKWNYAQILENKCGNLKIIVDRGKYVIWNMRLYRFRSIA